MIQMFKNCVPRQYLPKILVVDFFIMVCYYILWFFGINDTNCPGFRTALGRNHEKEHSRGYS